MAFVSEKSSIEALKQQGYQQVYTWHASPFEEDHEHSHPFDTHLLVLEGEIEISIGDQATLLKPGNELNILRQVPHSGKAGKDGCKYIVAEKH